MSSNYARSAAGHSSYGSAPINGQLHPVWEGAGVFAARALGPVIHSAGYPSPSTLPPTQSGSDLGYTASSGMQWSWKLLLALAVVAVAGILIVHHATWR
jgi:hypothetical protein